MVMHIYNKSVENMIREYRSNCDLLIMICHTGMEGWNIPLPEWRDLYKHFIDIGTDIVIAHHPHVAQGWENYNGGHIFYSLGNFAFNKGNKILNNRGLGVIIEYDENKNLTYCWGRPENANRGREIKAKRRRETSTRKQDRPFKHSI